MTDDDMVIADYRYVSERFRETRDRLAELRPAMARIIQAHRDAGYTRAQTQDMLDLPYWVVADHWRTTTRPRG